MRTNRWVGAACLLVGAFWSNACYAWWEGTYRTSGGATVTITENAPGRGTYKASDGEEGVWEENPSNGGATITYRSTNRNPPVKGEAVATMCDIEYVLKFKWRDFPADPLGEKWDGTAERETN